MLRALRSASSASRSSRQVRPLPDQAQPTEDTVTATTFVIRGRGWGHGVGMGQWGAYGQAKRGVPYKKILSHYYPGTKLAEARTTSVRVLLADGRRTVTIASEAPFSLMDGEGEVHDLAPGSYSTGTGFAFALDPALPPQALPGPLTFLRGSEPLLLGTKPYRGNLQLQRVHGRLQVVNVVGRRPVHPRRRLGGGARRLAARGRKGAGCRRALVRARAGGREVDPLLRHAEPGVRRDRGRVGCRRQGCCGTKRQVLDVRRKVATTFFFSSSGGRTADVEDVFIGGKPIPYLVSVPDPDDKLSPYHRWGPVVLAGAEGGEGARRPAAIDLRTVPVSGRAKEIVVQTKTGERRVPSSTFRRALDLRSTWVTIGVLSLSRPAGMAAAGSPVTLTGTARAVKGPITLEQKTAGQPWGGGRPIELAADRSFALDVVPDGTTQYRLTAGGRSRLVAAPGAGGRRVRALGCRWTRPRVRVDVAAWPAVLRRRSARRAPVAPGLRARVRLLG